MDYPKKNGKEGNWRLALVAIVVLLAGSAVMSFVTGCNSDSISTTADPVVSSFAFTADSRIDAGTGTTALDNLYLVNTPVMERLIQDMQAAKPEMLFFGGDMIMNYDSTLPLGVSKDNVIGPQYLYWRGLVAPLLATGTYVVPVAGNHETSDINPANGKKIVTVANEVSWRTFMGDLVDGIAGALFRTVTGTPADNVNLTPPPVSGSGIDNVYSDQSKLTYSFDYKGAHYIVVNNDPFIDNASFGSAYPKANTTGSVANAWLAADLAAFRARKPAGHIFIFGHRPAYSYAVGGVLFNGLDGKDSTPSDNVVRDAFWNLVEQYKATYFCGHEHTYHPTQPLGAGKAWQMLVGTAGAPFEPGATALDNTYAWVNVSVHQSGRVKVEVRGFDNVQAPTRVIGSWELPAGF